MAVEPYLIDRINAEFDRQKTPAEARALAVHRLLDWEANGSLNTSIPEHLRSAVDSAVQGVQRDYKLNQVAQPPLTIVESPYAGRHGASCGCSDCKDDVGLNVDYARAALHDCLLRGEAPFASHLLYTQPGVLDDMIQAERAHGIEAGLSIGDACQKSAVFVDRGYSRGMTYGIDRARQKGRVLELRSIPGWGDSVSTGESSKLLGRFRFWRTGFGDNFVSGGRKIIMPEIPNSEPQPIATLLSGMLQSVAKCVIDGEFKDGLDWTVIHVEQPGGSGYRLGVCQGTPEFRIG